jgi:hypothetical protein
MATPLRKDYEQGEIPVQFSRGLRRPPDRVDRCAGGRAVSDIVDVIRSGNEPAQGLKPRSETTARELLREVGSVLRMSEAEAAKLGDIPVDPSEDQTMIINMGRSTRAPTACCA